MTLRRDARLALALAALVLAATAAGHAQQEPRQPLPVFRAGVDVVSLNVTVTDNAGRYVTEIPAEEFSVFEDGVKQDIVFFSKSQLPIALALLLDTSASMDQKLSTAQQAAIGFAKRLRPDDVAEIIDFDSRVEITQTFTNDAGQLEKAILSSAAGGSTSMHNAIYIALKELKKIKATKAEDVRRQAIVVLSDGEDTTSLVSYEEVLDLAKRSETAIYCIGLRDREGTGSKNFREAEFVLRQLAQETGGRAYFTLNVADLPNIYSQISEELASQYSLAYSSKNPKRDGAWRRIVVRTARQGAIARTKQGYYGPTTTN